MTENPDPGTGAEYAEQVRAVLHRAAAADQATGHIVRERRPLLLRPPVLALLFLAFGAVVVWNIKIWNRTPDPLPPQAVAVSEQLSLMVATQAVEAYRQEHGRLPASLEEVGLPTEPFEYRVTGDRYTLTAKSHETREGVASDGAPDSLLRSLGFPLPSPPNTSREPPR